jgi:peptidoglycan L-alanyl-D-glutamate endopeptidase CwlK
MLSYGDRSERHLRTCHKDLQTIFREVIKFYDCSLICGHRNKAAQDKVFSDGMSKVQWPDSKHNTVPSVAIDAVPYPINWKDTNEMRHFAGVVQGVAQILFRRGEISHLVRWGGDWDKDNDLNDQSFMDLPHFELYKPEKGVPT